MLFWKLWNADNKMTFPENFDLNGNYRVFFHVKTFSKKWYLMIYWRFCACLSNYVQDSVFRLEPHVENGRGKSPYDPKLLTASMLIGEFKRGYTALSVCVC